MRGGKRTGAGRKKIQNQKLLRKSVGVRLPVYLAEWLTEEAKRQGISQGELIEKALILQNNISLPLPFKK